MADSANPLLQPWQTPYGLPPFDKVDAEHYLPAFLHAMHAHRAEVNAIAANPDAPTFDNTIAALDRCGDGLHRIERLFFNLTASETSPDLQAIERDIFPAARAHHSAARDGREAVRAHRSRARGAPTSCRPDGEERRLTSASTSTSSRAERAAFGRRRQARYAAIVERPRPCCRPGSCRTFSAMKPTTACRSSRSATSQASRTTCGRPAREAALGTRRRHARHHHAVRFVDRASSSRSRSGATCASRRTPRVDDGGEHDGARDNVRSRRDPGSAQRAGAPARLRHYAEHALEDRMAGTAGCRGAPFSPLVWEPAKARAAAERDALAALANAQGADPFDRAVGLAVLRRKSAQGSATASTTRS
jgi:peptidyl-dipeptidase Dcp